MKNINASSENCANLQLDVPEHFNFAGDVLDKFAEDTDKLALWWIDDDGNEIKKTFAQLCQDSRKVCNILSAQGIQRGDVVIVILPRLIEWWVINIACLRMGVIISPGTIQLTSKDIRYRLETAGAVCIIADNNVAARVDKGIKDYAGLKSKIVLGDPINGDHVDGWADYNKLFSSASDKFETANTRSDENAIFYFTSGTTDYPKLVVHTHSSYPIGHKITGALWLGLNSTDLHWNVSDTGWAKAAWSSFFGPWNMGSTIFVHHSTERGFNSKKMLEILCKYPITTLCAAPTVYRMLVLEDLNASNFQSLRDSVAAGEPLNPEVIEKWKKATGIIIRDGYGQTETVLLVGNFPSTKPRFGSMGKPVPNFDINIIDDQGNILPSDKEGDIAIRVKPNYPIGLFKEYWNDPAATSGAFKGDWYITGDRAYQDKDGYLWFVGRADDVILSAGYRIGPFEVESALLEHDAVAESAVVASPDELRGEIVKAFVVLKPGFEPTDDLVKELQEHTKKVTAPYKYPREIEFVENLPKTVSGKIRRVELRKKGM
ncbi:MAG: AMP-binding protein [Candidatus Anammoxibacter sp.]